MNNFIISTAVSIVLSICLLRCDLSWQMFAVWFIVIITTLAGCGVLFLKMVEGETAARIREWFWFGELISGLQVYALVVSGHPLVAAYSLTVSTIIVGQAFSAERAQ